MAPSRSQLISSLVNQVLGGASKKALAKKFAPKPEVAEEASEGETEMGDDEMAELEAALSAKPSSPPPPAKQKKPRAGGNPLPLLRGEEDDEEED